VQSYRSTFAMRVLLYGAGLLFLCIGGARAQVTSAGAAASSAMHEVTDEVGRTVRVPVNPQRIISLAPSLTETLYALHVEDRLVGDTVYCDYPVDAQKKAKVGGVIDPNLEQIAALHPDLVLVTKGANRLETVRALDALGIPSYATDPHSVDEIISSTRKLAEVLNIPETGRAVSEDLQTRLEELHTMLKSVPPKRVLFVVWTEPLISVGKDTFIADALRRAGAVSIVESSQDWPQISLEEIAKLQPDYLVFAASHTDIGERNFEELKDRAGWRILEAVQKRRFAVISEAVIRPAPRIVSAIEELARQLHPEVFMRSPELREMQSKPSAALRDDIESEGGKMLALPRANTESFEESRCVR
jgi:iron complex transport system substrate-binding protein